MMEGLLASKICHDLANRLTSVICAKEMLCEQIQNNKQNHNNNCMQDLSNTLELMSLNLSFFQNIVIQTAHIANLYDILIKMCKISDIKVNIDFTGNKSSEYFEENIICGLLYVIISNSIKTKRQTEIEVKFDENTIISIIGFKFEDVPIALNDILSTTTVQANNINVFAMYIKKIMDENGYALLIKETQNRVDLFIRKTN